MLSAYEQSQINLLKLLHLASRIGQMMVDGFRFLHGVCRDHMKCFMPAEGDHSPREKTSDIDMDGYNH